MTWFKVDDSLWSHPKFLALSDAAQALWMRAGSYCAAHLTDGFITTEGVRAMVRGKPAAIRELTTPAPGRQNPLWIEVPGGYRFHNWEKYQPAAAYVKRRRNEARDRMAKRRENGHDVRANVSNDVTHPVPSRPVPMTDGDLTGPSSAPERETPDDDRSRPGEGMRPDLGRIAERLTNLAGRNVSELEAGPVAWHVLDKAKRPPRSATAYVLSSITRDPEVFRNFLQSGRWSE